MASQVYLKQGDLVSIEAEAIVNPWNRNLLPWRLLRPHGVSARLKEVAGHSVFDEVQKYGPLKPGHAVLTGAGKLPYRAIIHVAAIGLLGRSSLEMIRLGTQNALQLATEQQLKRIAFPLLGTGSGGLAPQSAYEVMRNELELHLPDFDQLIVVIYDQKVYDLLQG